MNKLDTTIYRMMLSYPLLFKSRWDALRFLYLVPGNGFEWVGSEIRYVFEEFDEAKARASYFDDLQQQIEEEQKDLASSTHGSLKKISLRRLDDLDLEMAERRHRLDNIERYVRAKRRHDDRICVYDICRTGLGYALILEVPDDAEESFKSGAIEVLNELIPALHLISQDGKDNGVRETLIAVLNRLCPPPSEDFIRKLRAILDKPSKGERHEQTD